MTVSPSQVLTAGGSSWDTPSCPLVMTDHLVSSLLGLRLRNSHGPRQDSAAELFLLPLHPFQKYDLGISFRLASNWPAPCLSQPPECWGWLQMCTTSSSLACFTSTLLWCRPSFLHQVHFPGHLSPPCQVLGWDAKGIHP